MDNNQIEIAAKKLLDKIHVFAIHQRPHMEVALIEFLKSEEAKDYWFAQFQQQRRHTENEIRALIERVFINAQKGGGYTKETEDHFFNSLPTPSYQSGEKWISVEDRLPENSDKVLV